MMSRFYIYVKINAKVVVKSLKVAIHTENDGARALYQSHLASKVEPAGA